MLIWISNRDHLSWLFVAGKFGGRVSAFVAVVWVSALTGNLLATEESDYQHPIHERHSQVVDRFGIEADPDAVEKVENGDLDTAIAAWWGFDAEDATASLQSAIDSGAEHLIVPAMDEPWAVEPIFFTRDDQTILFEEGTVIEAKKGAFHGLNDSLFEGRDRENLTLIGYGATFRMQKKDYWSEDYEGSQWRNALDIRGSTNVKILGLTVRDSGGDGIYLGRTDNQPYNQNVVIRHVVSDNNHRQGLSVITAENLLVEDSVFSNTRGHSPMAGIDLEPNQSDEKLVNVVIRNCLFLDNEHLGFTVFLGHLDESSEEVSVLWENNYVRGGEIGIHITRILDDTPSGEVVIRNNMVEGTRHAGILMRAVSADNELNWHFENNVLVDNAHLRPYSEDLKDFYKTQFGLSHPDEWWRHPLDWRRHFPAAPIVLHAQLEYSERQGNIRFDNCFVVDNQDRPAVIISGTGNPEGEPVFKSWTNVRGQIFVSNPHGARMERRVPVEDFDLAVRPTASAEEED